MIQRNPYNVLVALDLLFRIYLANFCGWITNSDLRQTDWIRATLDEQPRGLGIKQILAKLYCFPLKTRDQFLLFHPLLNFSLQLRHRLLLGALRVYELVTQIPLMGWGKPLHSKPNAEKKT